ncbi:MAG: S-layer family protein [Cyanobacteriota bacterium]|nr:S-layer family protein [Cyanobacteriota bacterium]
MIPVSKTEKTPEIRFRFNSVQLPTKHRAWLVLPVACCLFPAVATAQITPDTTLPSNSIVTPDGNTLVIDGGTSTGNNLFHSFQEFSVSTGAEAHFNNTLTIDNIITRVTGGNLSDIDGLIRANGTANLFLLNPNGIVFGPNAQLDVGGSFIGSTADRLNFEDGSFYSATQPNAPPLLTINVPIGLDFGSNPGDIVNRANTTATDAMGNVVPVGLQVQPENTLALIGGNVLLEGGTIASAGGNVTIGAVDGEAQVDLTRESNRLGVSYDRVGDFQDIQLSQGARIDTSGVGGGAIQLQGRGIELSERSAVISNTLGNRDGAGITITGSQLSLNGGSYVAANTFGDGAAGNITVNASESINLTGVEERVNLSIEVFDKTSFDPIQNLRSGLFSLSFGVGSTGEIDIRTDTLTLRDGSTIWSRPFDAGSGSNITLEAQMIEVTSSVIETVSLGSGSSGEITINAENLLVQNQGLLSSSTVSSQAGDIKINAESIELIGTPVDNSVFFTFIAASTAEQGQQAGDITIDTDRLILRNGALIRSDAIDSGRGGNIVINATESVELLDPLSQQIDPLTPIVEDSTISSGTTGRAELAGDITIDTGKLVLANGATISASADNLQLREGSILSTGRAGTIRIDAEEVVEVRGISPDGRLSSIRSTTAGSGDAGGIDIQTPILRVLDGGQISVGTLGTGEAGDLTIDVDDLDLNGSIPKPELDFNPDDFENGDNIDLDLSELAEGQVLNFTAFELTEELGNAEAGRLPSSISAVSFGSGRAGNIIITADELQVRDGALLGVGSFETANAGDINVTAEDIKLDTRGTIAATTASGEGGDITLRAGASLQMRRNSQISTEANGTGNGGNLNLDAPAIVALENSDIIANAFEGNGGNINITTQRIFGTEVRSELTPESDITASSQSGVSGAIAIAQPNVDPTSGLLEPIRNPFDDTALYFHTCDLYANSEFYVIGRGAVVEGPGGELEADAIFVDLGDDSIEALNSEEGDITARGEGEWPLPPPPPIEATGWVVGPDGTIELIAATPGGHPWYTHPDCANIANRFSGTGVEAGESEGVGVE